MDNYSFTSSRSGHANLVQGSSRLPLLRAIGALSLLAAAAIHAAVVPEHLREWYAAGVFFVALAAAELLASVVFVSKGLWRSRRLRLGLIALSAGTIVLWLVSRTTGLPFGPERWTPEAVGSLDVTSSLLEAGTILAVLAIARQARPVVKRWARSEREATAQRVPAQAVTRRS